VAKSTGTWHTLIKIGSLAIPSDLAKSFARVKAAENCFNAFPSLVKRDVHDRNNQAKKPETPAKRPAKTIYMVAQKYPGQSAAVVGELDCGKRKWIQFLTSIQPN
jgi:uncharacterized protein YdeI (YjbR/CyaY-like superfamily)